MASQNKKFCTGVSICFLGGAGQKYSLVGNWYHAKVIIWLSYPESPFSDQQYTNTDLAFCTTSTAIYSDRFNM